MLCLAFFAVLPVLFGWHGTVVQSGSMEPHISRGDVVLAAPLDADSPVPMGGVVEYRSPAEAEPSGVEKTRLHRIVGENTDGTFVTAGDANVDVDSTPITREQINGQARLLIPWVGLPGLWLASGDLSPLALWSLLTLAAVAAAVLGVTSRRSVEDHGEDTSPQDDCGNGGGNGIDDGDDPIDGGDDNASGLAETEQIQQATGWPDETVASPVQRISTAFGIVATLVAMTVMGASAFSSAAFTATSTNVANTFSAATDWVPPTVTLASPGTTVRDTVLLSATAADAGSGIRKVVIQYALASTGTWVNLCTSESTPYACAWNTTTLPDGAYLLRATATDKVGLSTTSEPIRTTVANSFTVVLTDPGETARGTINLSTTLSSPGTIPYTVRVEYTLADTNNWKPICQKLITPYDCAWNTTSIADKDYDLRAVAVSGTSTTYSNIVTDVLVDNTAPLVSLKDPGVMIRGTTTFEATASDAASGVAQVQVQYLRSGTSTWVTMCNLEEEPYSCRFDTTTMAYGTYSFRAVATDEAGNTSFSSATSYRTVDNTVATVSVEDPGAYLTGSVTLRAFANSTAGITNVRIQTAPAGTTTWTTRCSVNAAPFSCPWNTATVTDGLFDIRAILLDATGKETISSTIANRRVDNSPLRASDIQTTNGPGIAGRIDNGDTLNFSYSQLVNLTTVSPGWNGAPIPVTIRLRDGNLLGLGNSGDTVDIQRSNSSVNLGSVNTKGNFAKSFRTVYLNATMTASTVTINGIPRTVISVTVGSVASGSSSLRTNTTSANMVWSPLSTVRNTNGSASSTTPVTETPPLDRDF
ncbi:Ig-like domain-containing protein [Arthrobacter psychrochitiniphilus]|uniref:Ig-like domain-containing protein n=1 Tax=Arthrobacter psychrochitiniphilus TaxID=291045 RepID=UPI003F7B83F9